MPAACKSLEMVKEVNALSAILGHGSEEVISSALIYLEASMLYLAMLLLMPCEYLKDFHLRPGRRKPGDVDNMKRLFLDQVDILGSSFKSATTSNTRGIP